MKIRSPSTGPQAVGQTIAQIRAFTAIRRGGHEEQRIRVRGSVGAARAHPEVQLVVRSTQGARGPEVGIPERRYGDGRPRTTYHERVPHGSGGGESSPRRSRCRTGDDLVQPKRKIGPYGSRAMPSLGFRRWQVR